MTSIRHLSAFATVAGIAALLAFPLPAAARERDVPQVGPLQAGYAPGDVRDDDRGLPFDQIADRLERGDYDGATVSTHPTIQPEEAP